eukprot:TRINITY_DN5655_c0_g1_i1.p1 TRINITY_DN5655_c0_g1~~TRINITY_DN5655_c0_g1_i1.p1  ORF type:complete len:382 (+),score=69.05 TRINITY_DN5655_c0_g1_i1:1349-2494(+)
MPEEQFAEMRANEEQAVVGLLDIIRDKFLRHRSSRSSSRNHSPDAEGVGDEVGSRCQSRESNAPGPIPSHLDDEVEGVKPVISRPRSGAHSNRSSSPSFRNRRVHPSPRTPTKEHYSRPTSAAAHDAIDHTQSDALAQDHTTAQSHSQRQSRSSRSSERTENASLTSARQNSEQTTPTSAKSSPRQQRPTSSSTPHQTQAPSGQHTPRASPREPSTSRPSSRHNDLPPLPNDHHASHHVTKISPRIHEPVLDHHQAHYHHQTSHHAGQDAEPQASRPPRSPQKSRRPDSQGDHQSEAQPLNPRPSSPSALPPLPPSSSRRTTTPPPSQVLLRRTPSPTFSPPLEPSLQPPFAVVAWSETGEVPKIDGRKRLPTLDQHELHD